MNTLPITPLIEISFDTTLPRIFCKCENKLPFGGGNKVRRFLEWLKENSSVNYIDILSDFGSHSFLILHYILQQPEYSHIYATFWQRDVLHNPYRDNIFTLYQGNKNIKLTNYSLKFFLRWLKFLFSKKHLFSVGGKISLKQNPFSSVLDETILQLQEHNLHKKNIWHIFPVASGMMADNFLKYFSDGQLHTHKILGLLTGDSQYRFFLRWKYYRNKKIRLLNTSTITWNQYLQQKISSDNLFKNTLDPIHTCHYYAFINNLPTYIDKNDVVIFWMTQPEMMSDNNMYAT